MAPLKGTHVRFSVFPPNGPGNCNVTVRPNPNLAGMSQPELDKLIDVLPHDRAAWAEFAGVPSSNLTVTDSRRGRHIDRPALLGTLEATVDNLEGRFTRKQMVAVMLRDQHVWALNCGATSFNADEARARFITLESTFNKIFGSFRFVH